MILSSGLISDFVKTTSDVKNEPKEATLYGKIVKNDSDTYVKLDGSDLLTPALATTTVEDGERVTVLIKNHRAIVTGNLSSPSARLADVNLVVESIVAQEAVIDDLKANVANINILVSDMVTTENLVAETAKLGYMTADVADLKYAQINLANIDTANIDKATIKDLFVEVGLVTPEATIENGHITGELGAITISANNITAGKLDAGEIEVVNLNAASITVGQINGTQIASGAIDMDNLSSDVSEWMAETENDVSQALKDAGMATTVANNAEAAINNFKIGGRNLFIDSTKGSGFIANADTISAASEIRNEIYSDYIPVNEGESIIFQLWTTPYGNDMSTEYPWRAWVFYDSDKAKVGDRQTANDVTDYINGVSHTVNTLTVPSRASYMRITARTYADGKIKVERGTKPTDYSVAPEDVDEDIEKAVTIANGKNTNYYQSVAPSGGTYAVNDNWFDTANGYALYKWNGTTWEKSEFGSEAIAASAINAGKIAAGAVTTDSLAANAVTAAKILAGSIETAHIATSAINADKIAAGAITADKIEAGAITADKIQVDEALTTKIFATDITATGTITGGSFIGSTFEGVTGTFTGNITAATGKIGFLTIGTDSLYTSSGKYGEFTIKDKSIYMDNRVDDTGAGNITSYTPGRFEMSTITSKTGGGTYTQYSLAYVPHLLRISQFNTSGTEIYATRVRPSSVQTPELYLTTRYGTSTGISTIIAGRLQPLIIALGDISISTASPFSMDLSAYLENNETPNLHGVVLNQCWPHSTWNCSCMAQLQGNAVYISTTYSQTYTVILTLLVSE